MSRRFVLLLQFTFVTLDLFVLNVAFYISQLLFAGKTLDHFGVQYTYLWLCLNFSWIVVAFISGVYHAKQIRYFESFSRRTMHAFFYFVFLVIIYLFFYLQLQLPRSIITTTLVAIGMLFLLNRFTYLFLNQYFKRNQLLSKRVIILGYNDLAKKLVSYLEDEGLNIKIIGFCENEENVRELSHYPILSPINESVKVSHQYEVTEIYSTIAPEHDSGIYQLMHEADQACIRFKVIPDFNFYIQRPVHVQYLREMPLLSLRNEPLEDAGNQLKKRTFDVVVSLLVIIFILSWMIPLLGLLIYLESPGPIFFRQSRTGKGKRTFKCLKFRSMKINNEAETRQAVRNDSRVTRIGKFIRKTNLDEMPQFINVLKGDMSIVGPRPHPVTFFSMLRPKDDFFDLHDQFTIRHFVKPGVTGWAQVNGLRGEILLSEQLKKRIEYDIWYLENWNLWLDVRIMFLTVYTTIKGDRNAF